VSDPAFADRRRRICIADGASDSTPAVRRCSRFPGACRGLAIRAAVDLPFAVVADPIKAEQLPLNLVTVTNVAVGQPIEAEKLPFKVENVTIEAVAEPIRVEKLPIKAVALRFRTVSLPIADQKTCAAQKEA